MGWQGTINGKVQNRVDLPLKGSVQHVSEAERPNGRLDIPFTIDAATPETKEQYGNLFTATAAEGKTDHWKYAFYLGGTLYTGDLKCNIKHEDTESNSLMYLIIERNDDGVPQFRTWFPISSACKMAA